MSCSGDFFFRNQLPRRGADSRPPCSFAFPLQPRKAPRVAGAFRLILIVSNDFVSRTATMSPALELVRSDVYNLTVYRDVLLCNTS
jgi:hypothetical protein